MKGMFTKPLVRLSSRTKKPIKKASVFTDSTAHLKGPAVAVNLRQKPTAKKAVRRVLSTTDHLYTDVGDRIPTDNGVHSFRESDSPILLGAAKEAAKEASWRVANPEEAAQLEEAINTYDIFGIK
jgi:hypothetical protein